MKANRYLERLASQGIIRQLEKVNIDRSLTLLRERVDGLSIQQFPDTGVLSGEDSLVEVVGMLDRRAKRVVVAQKFGFEQSRFTLAHEIAHYLMHPGMILHRERPLNFWNHAARPLEEREADLFGAELLMPSKLVREEFLARFDGVVDHAEKDEALYYWLSLEEPNLDKQQFCGGKPHFRALQLAKTRSCFGRRIVSMCEFFRVSPSAMAIQLTDLGLVR